MKVLASEKFKIAVCGSAGGKFSAEIARSAREIGREIARSNHILFTGATTGYSLEAAIGASEYKGVSVGISPAENETDQLQRFEKIDTQLWSVIIYTGVGYKMRDVIMLRSIDAAIFVGGGVGTLLEMTVSIDLRKVLGVLDGSGGATDLIYDIGKISHRVKPEFITDADPVRLVKKVINRIERVKYARKN